MIRTLHVKSCINVTGSLCFNDDDDEQHQFCRHKQKRQEWKQFDGVFEVDVLFIPYHRINEKKKPLHSMTWHWNGSNLRESHFFSSFSIACSFSEIPIFARFSAILRHGQRNAKYLFTYLTKVKVSTRQQIWANGNVNDVTAIMPRSNTIILTFHLAAYAGLWHDDTPITSYYIQQPYELFGTEYQPYPLFTAFSVFLSPFECLEDVLVL